MYIEPESDAHNAWYVVDADGTVVATGLTYEQALEMLDTHLDSINS